MTKADVLCEEAIVKVYSEGNYQELPGWDSVHLDGNKEKLHPNLENFVSRVEEYVGVPVIGLGTGPDRADFHWRQEAPDFWA
jgi:adenylosuccinate synthase